MTREPLLVSRRYCTRRGCGQPAVWSITQHGASRATGLPVMVIGRACVDHEAGLRAHLDDFFDGRPHVERDVRITHPAPARQPALFEGATHGP